tara:strand:+ start:179 stop:796 length:618 start_codon:yes stop_codon:yes gene_type:complete
MIARVRILLNNNSKKRRVKMKDLNVSTLNDMLGALSTRKRPCDMENILNHEVYSKGRGEHIKIGDMALEHVLRKFYLLLNDDQFDKKKPSDTQVYHDLHAKIAKLDELLEEKDEIIDKFAKEEHRWRKAYHDNFNLEGHRYTFSDIPNDASGRAFVAQLREYLNTDSYKIRVRGQYLVDGENWRRYSFGQPIEKSKCLRVYVDKK